MSTKLSGMNCVKPLVVQCAHVAGLAWLLAAVPNRADGHQDPLGDIHPQVTVMDGKFSIVFNTSLPQDRTNFTDESPVSQMIFEADGTLFAPRHPLDRKRSWRELGSVGIYGRETRLGDSSVFFQGSSGQPGYLLKSPDGKLARVRLPWPEKVSLSLFEDVLVTPAGIAITGKEGRDRAGTETLNFYWFAHEATGGPTILSLGPTACIYDFPVASNIAFAGGRFWIAFMRPIDKELKLTLWSWQPGGVDGRMDVLDSPADWNSHLSLAAIGDRLCLAYHHANEYSGFARIVTVFRKAE